MIISGGRIVCRKCHLEYSVETALVGISDDNKLCRVCPFCDFEEVIEVQEKSKQGENP